MSSSSSSLTAAVSIFFVVPINADIPVGEPTTVTIIVGPELHPVLHIPIGSADVSTHAGVLAYSGVASLVAAFLVAPEISPFPDSHRISRGLHCHSHREELQPNPARHGLDPSSSVASSPHPAFPSRLEHLSVLILLLRRVQVRHRTCVWSPLSPLSSTAITPPLALFSSPSSLSNFLSVFLSLFVWFSRPGFLCPFFFSSASSAPFSFCLFCLSFLLSSLILEEALSFSSS